MLSSYYATPAVRDRMHEFLGGRSLEKATCMYVTGMDGDPDAPFVPQAPHRLPFCLEQGWDVTRSLWDRAGLVVHLDVEYANPDYPGEAYLDPHRTFDLQRPVAESIEELLLRHGVAPLHLLTGRGHHFVWMIRRDSDAFDELAELGQVPESLRRRYAMAHPPADESVDEALGRAFAGLGLVMEHVAHRVKECAAPQSRIPVQLTDVAVGSGERGREVVSIDLSEYFDPLHTRHIRIPFSAYLKPHRNRRAVGEHVLRHTPLAFPIPLFEMSVDEALDVMRDADRTARLARRAPTRIPDFSEEMCHLIAAYRSSELAVFHQAYYAQAQRPPESWPRPCGRTTWDDLPSCLVAVLEHPNDLLLQPAGIQLAVRVLMAVGWHPRQVAGLICAKYESDHDWGDQWRHYDPAYRADGYTRLFAGLIATGRDRLIDFNCVSNREKGFCVQEECGHNLDEYRRLLTDRRQHERLGRGTIDGMLLPDQHL